MPEGKPGQEPEPSSPVVAPAPMARLDLVGANLRGTSMAGRNLDYADFRAADVRGVDFSGSSLRYADFRGSLAQGANFQDASLYGAKMQGMEAFGANFRQADLRQANTAGAYLHGALMPEPARLLSPGEIAYGAAPGETAWDQRLAAERGGPDLSAADEPAREVGRRRGRGR